MTKPSNLKLQALIEQARRNHAAKLAKEGLGAAVTTQVNENFLKTNTHIAPANRNLITEQVLTVDDSFHKTISGFEYNEKQMEAIELAMRAKSFNLIGAAGTGKTTTTREVIGQLVKLPHITPLQESTKWLAKESPGIVVISFTNKAVNNLKKFLPEELKKHCLTYHKLLQYEPVVYELEPGNPAGKKTMRFEPSFGPTKPLPHISCIIIEESSMVPGDGNDVGQSLHSILVAALPNPAATQFIFLGDLNQLPPIFGPSILGFKLLQLQTVELTHVYRQALESPIITLAHKIREGRGFSDKLGRGTLTTEGFVDDRGEHGKVTIHPWKKKQESGNACKVAQGFLIKLIQSGKYNVDEDIILCPFNKSFGTLELNRSIADFLGKQREAEVYEIIARYQKSYFAVGDRVLVDRMEARIIRIEPTPGYSGPVPAASSKTLNRWGIDAGEAKPDEELTAVDAFNILDSLVVGGGDDEAETKNSASHTITIEFIDTGAQRSFSDAGNINSMLFSYVLTVHKSQGSEWKRVFILLHYSHNSMLSRELLYTAVTRARQELFIICEPDKGEVYNSITRAAKSPEIHGVSLKEKAQYFTRKAKEMVSKGSKPAEILGKRRGQKDIETLAESAEDF